MNYFADSPVSTQNLVRYCQLVRQMPLSLGKTDSTTTLRLHRTFRWRLLIHVFWSEFLLRVTITRNLQIICHSVTREISQVEPWLPKEGANKAGHVPKAAVRIKMPKIRCNAQSLNVLVRPLDCPKRPQLIIHDSPLPILGLRVPCVPTCRGMNSTGIALTHHGDP